MTLINDTNYQGLYPSLYPSLSIDSGAAPDSEQQSAPENTDSSVTTTTIGSNYPGLYFTGSNKPMSITVLSIPVSVSEEQESVAPTESSAYTGYPILKPLHPTYNPIENNSAHLLEQYQSRELPTILNLALAVNHPLEETLKFYEENLIPEELQAFQRSFPEENYQCYFETKLRETLTAGIISKLAADFKAQFQAGVLNVQDMESVFEKLATFNSANGKFLSLNHPKFELLAQTFDLSRDDFMGSILKANSEVANKINDIKQPHGSLKNMFKLFQKTNPEATAEKESELKALSYKKGTLEWILKTWSDHFYPKLPAENPEFATGTTDSETSSQNEETSSDEDFVLVDATETSNNASSPEVTIPALSSEAIKSTMVLPVMAALQKEEHITQIASYLDIVYNGLFNMTDREIWSSLTKHSKRDIFRHVTILPHINGKAEGLARRIFKGKEWKIYEYLHKHNHLCSSAQLDPEFIAKGEELIEFFYSTKSNDKFHIVMQKLKELPIAKAPNFLKYVYEIAKASDVKIEEWDHKWAENNWTEVKYFHIALQALEYCLHTETPSQA